MCYQVLVMARTKALAKPTRAAAASATSGPKRAQKRVDKRERIRDAAWSLFNELGYAATTTKKIAQRAGVASGTLFLYADDKPDLLFLVFHERLRAAVDEARGSLPKGAGFLDQLLHIFGGVFRMYAESPALAGEFVRALPGATGRNAQDTNAFTFGFLAHLAHLVREAQKTGELDPRVDPLLAARNIFSLYFGALLSWIMGLAPTVEAALDPVLRTSLALQMSGLAKK